MARVRAFPAVFLLLLLLIATGEMMGTAKVADARTCTSPSHTFKGLCFSDRNCDNVCQTEHFLGEIATAPVAAASAPGLAEPMSSSNGHQVHLGWPAQ